MAHQHTAGGGCCHCDHSAAGDDTDGASLLPCIDVTNVICLNEKVSGAGKLVFKPHTDKGDKTKFVESPMGDTALIFRIPFTSAVRIKSICVSAGPDGRAPSNMRLYANREDVDFGTVDDIDATQSIDIPEDVSATTFHPVKMAKFSGVHTLHIYLNGSHGGDDLCVYYIGIKGIDTKARRTIVEAVYESRPTSMDTSLASEDMVGSKMR